MTGFEPATSWSQTTRATNCATSRSEKIFDFSVCSLSGQTCGQKIFAEPLGRESTRKCEKTRAFASFRRSASGAVTRSQTTRATNCATSRSEKIFGFSVCSLSGQTCGQKIFAEASTCLLHDQTPHHRDILPHNAPFVNPLFFPVCFFTVALRKQKRSGRLFQFGIILKCILWIVNKNLQEI